MPSPRDDHARKPLPHGPGTSFLPNTPLPTGSLDRLFALARGIQGEIAGVPAAHWWQAFLLTLLDTALDYRDLLNVSRSAFDPKERRLGVGLFTYELHPRTAAALGQLTHAHDNLFPWPWNRQTLAKRFEQLFDLAEIPRGVKPTDLLRLTGRLVPEVLDRIDFSLPCDHSIRYAKRAPRMLCLPQPSDPRRGVS